MEDKQLENNFIEWNKSYLDAIIDELKPTGNVLQVGFGLEHVANRIQSYNPLKHSIIEKNPQKVQEAKNWANKHPHVAVIEGSWQNILPTLGVFDTIFFNESNLSSGLEMAQRLTPEQAVNAANKAKEVLEVLQEQFSQIKTQYSDQEVEEFYQKTGQFYPKEMPQFFQTLKDKHCISENQYKKMIKKYNINSRLEKEPAMASDIEPLVAFLEKCVKDHMHKGSRFSAYMSNIRSKYEDSQFFDRFITDPNLEYQEKLVSIQVPNCTFNQALIMVLEKFA